MWTRRLKNLFARRRPRFQTPGSGIVLIVLALIALLLLTRGPGSPKRTYPSAPPPSANPPSESPIPRAALSPPNDTGPAEDGCPRGCASPPPGCDIKGNISMKTGERIYHLPGQRFYDKTVISPDDGEAWFCTEAEARENGWRKSKV